MIGFPFFWAFWYHSFEFNASLRRKKKPVPWNSLVPARVAIEIDAPLLRPSSAVALFVVTLYS